MRTLLAHLVPLVSLRGGRRAPTLGVLFTLMAVALTLVSPAPPALANSGPTNYCVTNVGYTVFYSQDKVVRGSGSMACGGASLLARLEVKLQRQRWYGWETIGTNSRGYTSFPVNWALGVGWYCGGAGTYTYRTVSSGYVKNWSGGVTGPVTVVSNYIRVSC